MKKLLEYILKVLSKSAIAKYKPMVIGITGSVGKTSTKEAIFSVLRGAFDVRQTSANYNNEIGFPMAILGLRKVGKLVWIPNILKSIWLIIKKHKNYPKILILEMAADKPGDIKYLTDIAKPNIGIVTALGEIPVHIEFFSGPEQIAKEKSNIVKALSSNDLAILNYDDSAVLNMSQVSKAQVMTFGFNQGADVMASDLNYYISQADEISAGITFKVNYQGKSVPFKLKNALAKHQVYSALCGVCVGMKLGLNLLQIGQALENLDYPKHRMKLEKGIKNTFIIDDTYNASPIATKAGLQTLNDFGNKIIEKQGIGRKIAVLGDMLELGQYTVKAHNEIGELAGQIADILVCVGSRAKLIAETARQSMNDNIYAFDTSDEAKLKVQDLIKQGDIILIKGSRAMKMENIVEEIIFRFD